MVRNPIAEYRKRLVDAGFSTSEQVGGLLGLGRKVGPMVVRGAALRPMLRDAASVPLVGQGVRVRDARQLSVGRAVVIEDFAEIQATSRDGIVLGDHVVIGPMTMIRPSG